MAIYDSIAWNYFKGDRNLVKKILIFYLLCLLSIPFPFVLIVLIGYYFNNAHVRIIKREDKLIEWDDFNSVVCGLKVFGISCILFPIFFILAILYFLPQVNNEASSQAFGWVMLFIVPILFLVFLPMLLTIVTTPFLRDLKFKSFLNFKMHLNIIKNKQFCGYFLRIILYNIIYYTICILLIFKTQMFGIIFIPAVIYSYIVVLSDIQAQFARIVFNIDSKQN